MSQSMPDIPLNDIQPLVDVPDYSIYLFAGVMGVVLITAVSLVLIVLKAIRGRRLNERKKAFRELEALDFSNPKKAAYAISRIGYRFAQDNERTAKAYQALFDRLEPYKYAPQVEMIDEETVGYYRLYLEMIDV